MAKWVLPNGLGRELGEADVERLARAMEPEAWQEYDAGNGRCTNMGGWKVLVSLDHARATIKLLKGDK